MYAGARHDLAYFADSRIPVSRRFATLYQEQGGLAGIRTRLLGDPVIQQQNLAAMEAFVNSHPLAPDASDDTRQTRDLLVAAIAHAKAVLANGDAGTAQADQAFQQARASYQDFTARQYGNEMPSPLALALSNIGLDVSSTVGKVALWGGLALGAYLLLPMLMRAGSRRSSY